MTDQHLHNRIGNAVGECKKVMFQRLSSGADLQTAIAQFICELNVKLDRIIAEAKT